MYVEQKKKAFKCKKKKKNENKEENKKIKIKTKNKKLTYKKYQLKVSNVWEATTD